MKDHGGNAVAGRNAGPWAIAVGAMIAMTVSGGPVGFAAGNIFIKPITEDIGWTRTEYFAAGSISVLLSGLAGIFIGGIADRFGVRRVLLVGIALFAAGHSLLSTLTGSMVQYFAITLFIGMMTAIQGPLLYSKAVSQAADRRRGLALAIAMSGSAIGMAILPHLASLYISALGWRSAKLALATTILVVAWPAVWFLIRPPKPAQGGPAAAAALPGLEIRQVLRTPAFWLLLLAFIMSIAAINGVVAHLGALVPDRGLKLQWAATCLSAVAAGAFLARFAAGILLDRFQTPQVGQLWFVSSFAGLVVMLMADTPVGLVAGSVLLGMGMGAELELLAFYVGRFFGLRAFGKVYGLLFGGYLLGVSIGGVLMARLYDWRGDYDLAIMIALGLVAAAALALAFVGRYAYVAEGHG